MADWFLVTQVAGPAWDYSRPRREQDGWDEHAAFVDGLAAEGLIVLCGPVGDPDVGPGLVVFEAESGGPGLEAQMQELAPDRVQELVDVYRAHNEPLHDELVCCAGIDGLLVRLKEEGRRLGIVTAKRRATVDLAFNVLPLRHLFETVVGGDETERHKPDPEPLLLAAERLNVAPAQCAYVGDSPFDIRAAKAAGMHAIAVTWGGIHDRAKLV